jgi:hypothetical protein
MRYEPSHKERKNGKQDKEARRITINMILDTNGEWMLSNLIEIISFPEHPKILPAGINRGQGAPILRSSRQTTISLGISCQKYLKSDQLPSTYTEQTRRSSLIQFCCETLLRLLASKHVLSAAPPWIITFFA